MQLHEHGRNFEMKGTVQLCHVKIRHLEHLTYVLHIHIYFLAEHLKPI